MANTISGSPGWRPRLLTAMGAFLWAEAVQDIILPVPLLREAGIALFLVYILLSIDLTQRTTRIVAPACVAVTILALATGAPLSAFWAGLDTVMLFMGFFPAITLISALIGQSGALDKVSDNLATMAGDQRRGATLVAAHAIGAVMTVGAFVTLAPPFRRMPDTSLRSEAGLTAIRGVALATFWTPFSLGAGYAGSHLPQVPLWMGLGCGAVIAVIGLMISLRQWNPLRLGPSMALVRQMAGPIVFTAVLLIALNGITGLGGTQLVILLAPLVAGSWLMSRGPQVRRETALQIGSSLSRLGDTGWLIGGSIVMGTVLSHTPWFMEALEHLGLSALPAPVIFTLLAFLGIAMALLGMHSTVIGAILTALMAGIGGRLEPQAAFVLILFGWHCGLYISVASVSSAIVSRNFDVSIGRLLFGPNLRFAVLMALVVSALYTVIHVGMTGSFT